MPRTGRRSSPALSIEISDLQPTYSPGDTLNGYVVCEKVPDQQPLYPAVKLRLFGRAKSKYTVQGNHGTSIDRGRAVLFEERKIVHRGSVCKNGEHAWKFSMTIPKTSAPGFGARGDTFREGGGYLHTQDPTTKQEIDVSKHALPSIMYYFSTSSMSGKTVEAYIEYALVAEAGFAEAYFPLYVRQQSVPSPITDFHMRTKSFTHLITNWSLIPEYAEKPMAISRKLKMALKRIKTPRYTYTVNVTYPTIIQLEHPDPIPLRISLIPHRDKGRTTICQDEDADCLPAVQVVSMEVKLKGDVRIRCPGTFWDSGTQKNDTFDFTFLRLIQPVAIPVLQTTGSKPSQSIPQPDAAPDTPRALSVTLSAPNGNEPTPSLTNAVSHPPPTPLDLGTRFSILLGCSASSTLNQRPVSFKRQVYPTFTTYNIAIHYRLAWKIDLAVARETHTVSGEAPVKVLAPSEQQEEKKKRELGNEGMKRNYDDLEAGVGAATQFIGQVLQVVGQ